MDAKEKVLGTMKEAGQPLNARSRPQRGRCSHEAAEGRGRNRLSCSLQMGTCRVMVQDSTTYYVWIGGSCDYGHKEPTHEARAESQARLGYALQEGGRRKSTCWWYMTWQHKHQGNRKDMRDISS